MAYPREEANQSWHFIYKTKYAYKIISMVYVVEVIFLIRDQLKRIKHVFVSNIHRFFAKTIVNQCYM